MDTSPADRLPEADSLPDGFVDSSSEPELSPAQTAQPTDSDYKQPLLDVDDPGVSPLQHEIPSSTAGSCDDDGPRAPPVPPQDFEGCSDSLSACAKGESASANGESLKNGKLEISKAKKKAAKCITKSEKELPEFTLKYQKVIAERDAAIAVRERLESLCRELQRQNKMLMNECQRVATEGQNMRQDLSAKFNDAIKDVSSKLDEQKDECISQLKENEMLRSKLQHLVEQYAQTEQQFAQKLKQKMLELQLADLKLQQQQERSSQEQTQIQLYAEQVAQLLTTERNLRSQLAADGEKFQQFQDALLKSNEVFETFKPEMNKMGTLIKDLKKENVFLKGKCEKSDIAIVKLIEEREHMKKQLEKLKNQKEKLESLCRSLQAERKQSLSDAADRPQPAPPA